MRKNGGGRNRGRKPKRGKGAVKGKGADRDKPEAKTTEPEDLAKTIAGVIATFMPSEEELPEELQGAPGMPGSDSNARDNAGGRDKGPTARDRRERDAGPGGPGGQNKEKGPGEEEEEMGPQDRLLGILEGGIPAPLPKGSEYTPGQLIPAFDALGMDEHDKILDLSMETAPKPHALLTELDIEQMMKGADALERSVSDAGEDKDEDEDEDDFWGGGIDPTLGALNLGDPSLYMGDKSMKTGGMPGPGKDVLGLFDSPSSKLPTETDADDTATEGKGPPKSKEGKGKPGKAKVAAGKPGEKKPGEKEPGADGKPTTDKKKEDADSSEGDSDTTPTADASTKGGKKDAKDKKEKKKKKEKAGGKAVKPMSQGEIRAEIERLEIQRGFKEIDLEILDLDINTHLTNLGDKQTKISKVQGKQQDLGGRTEKRKEVVNRLALSKQGQPGAPSADTDNQLKFLDLQSGRLPKKLDKLQGKVTKIQASTNKVNEEQGQINDDIADIDEKIAELQAKLESGGGGGTGNPDVPETCKRLKEDTEKKLEKETKKNEKETKAETQLKTDLEALKTTISEQKTAEANFDTTLGGHKKEKGAIEKKIKAQKAALATKKAADAKKGKAKGKAKGKTKAKSATKTTSAASNKSTKDHKKRLTELGKLIKQVTAKRKKAIRKRDMATKDEERKKLRLKEKQAANKELTKKLDLMKKAVTTLAKPMAFYQIIADGVGVKLRMAWLPKDARPWEAGDEDLSEEQRTAKDKKWTEDAPERKKKADEEKKKREAAKKLGPVGTDGKPLTPPGGETLTATRKGTKPGKKKKTPEEKAKEKQVQENNLLMQLSKARDMPPDARNKMLEKLANSQKPKPRNPEQLQKKIQELNLKLTNRLNTVKQGVPKQYEGIEILPKEMERIAKESKGAISVDDLKRLNEDSKRKKFQTQAMAYLGFDSNKKGNGQAAQDALFAMGKDRGLNARGMLERLRTIDPSSKIAKDVAPYMGHINEAKKTDEEYKKKYTGGQPQKAELEKDQKEATKSEGKVKDNRFIGKRLNISPLEVDSYVNTLEKASGVSEAEARGQLKKTGPDGYDPATKQDPAKLAAEFKRIHAIPIAKRKAALDAITKRMPPKAMLGALMRAGESADGLVKGPVANEALRTQVQGVEMLPPGQQWEAYCNLSNMTGMPFRQLRLAYKNKGTKEQALNFASGILNNNKLSEDQRQKKLEELAKKLNLTADALRTAYENDVKRTAEGLGAYREKVAKGKSPTTTLGTAIRDLENEKLDNPDQLERRIQAVSRLTGVPVDELRRYHANNFRENEVKKYGEMFRCTSSGNFLAGDKAYDQLLGWSRQYQVTPDEMMAMLRYLPKKECPPELRGARHELWSYDRRHPTEEKTDKQRLKAMKRKAGIGQNKKATRLLTDLDEIKKMPYGKERDKAKRDRDRYLKKCEALLSKLDESVVEDDDAWNLLNKFSPREIAALQADKNLVDEDGESFYNSYMDGCDGNPYQSWGKKLFAKGDAYNDLVQEGLQEKVDAKKADAIRVKERGQQNKALAANLGGMVDGKVKPIPIKDATTYIDAYAQKKRLPRDIAMQQLSNPLNGKTAKDLIGDLYKPTKGTMSPFLKQELKRANKLPESERTEAIQRIMGYSGLKTKDIQKAQKEVASENHAVTNMAAVEMLPESEKKKALEKLAKDLKKKPEEIQALYNAAKKQANARFEAAKHTNPRFKADLDALMDPTQCPASWLRNKVAELARKLNMDPKELLRVVLQRRFAENKKNGSLERWGGGTKEGTDKFLAEAAKRNMTPEEFADYIARVPPGNLDGGIREFKRRVGNQDIQLTEKEQKARKQALGDPNDPKYIEKHRKLLGLITEDCSDSKILAAFSNMTPQERALFVREYEKARRQGVKTDGDPLPPLKDALESALQGDDEDKGLNYLRAANAFNADPLGNSLQQVDVHSNNAYTRRRDALFKEMQNPGPFGPRAFYVKNLMSRMKPAERAKFVEEYRQLRAACSAQIQTGERTAKEVPPDLDKVAKGDHVFGIMVKDASTFKQDPIVAAATKKVNTLEKQVVDTDKFIAATKWKGDRKQAYVGLQGMAKQHNISASNMARLLSGEKAIDETNKVPAHIRGKVGVAPSQAGGWYQARMANMKKAQEAHYGVDKEPPTTGKLSGLSVRKEMLEKKQAKLEAYLSGSYMNPQIVVGMLHGCNAAELAALDKALKPNGLMSLISGRKSKGGYAMNGVQGEHKIELLSLLKKADDYKPNAKDDQLVLDLKSGDPRATADPNTPEGLADRMAWAKDLPPEHRLAELNKLVGKIRQQGTVSPGEQITKAFLAGTLGGDGSVMTGMLQQQVEAAEGLSPTQKEEFLKQLAEWGGFSGDVKELQKAAKTSKTNLKAAAKYQKILKLPPEKQAEQLAELTTEFPLTEGELDTILAKAQENGMLQEPTKEVPPEVDEQLAKIKEIKDPKERQRRLKELGQIYDLSHTDLIAHVNKKNAEARKQREMLSQARTEAEEIRRVVKTGDRDKIKKILEKYKNDPAGFQRVLKEYPEGAQALKDALRKQLNKTNPTSNARKALNWAASTRIGKAFGAKTNKYGDNDPDFVDFMMLIDRAEKFEPTPALPEGMKADDSRLLQDILKSHSDRKSDDYRNAVAQYKLAKGLNEGDFGMMMKHAEHQVKHFDAEVERHHFALANEVEGSLLWVDQERVKKIIDRIPHDQLAALYEKYPQLVNKSLENVGGSVYRDFEHKLKTARKSQKMPFEERGKFITKARVDHKYDELEDEFDASFTVDRDRIRELLKDCSQEELKMLDKKFGGKLQEKIDEAMKPTFFEAAVAIVGAVVLNMALPGIGTAIGAAVIGTWVAGGTLLGMGRDPETRALKAKIGATKTNPDGSYPVDDAKVKDSAKMIEKELHSRLWVNDSVILGSLARLNPAELVKLRDLMSKPAPEGVEVTDSKGNVLKLEELIKKHLDGDEKAAAVAMLKDAEDHASGRNRKQELDHTCREMAITQRVKELRKDPANKNKSPQEIYKLAVSDKKKLNKLITSKKKKIKDSANTLFKAIDGWGDDEKQVLKTLASLTPEEIDLVKVEYRRHFGKDFETQMREDMDLGDWKPEDGFEASGWDSFWNDKNEGKIALMMMSKKHRVEGVREMLLEYSDRSWCEDEDLIFATLENMTVEERTKLVSGKEGKWFLEKVKADLGTNERAMVDAITKINEVTGKADANKAHIAAVKMKMAMHGSGDRWDFSSWGTEEDDFLKAMDDLTPEQVQEAIRYYNENLSDGGSFMAEVMSDFSTSSPEFKVIDAEAMGDKAAADAWRLEYAADGWGTDEKLIEETLKAAKEGRGGRTKEHFARLKGYFNNAFGGPGGEYRDKHGTGQTALQIMLGDEMEGLERVYFEQLAEKGEADPELELAYSMHGLGTDEDRAKKILERVHDMSPAERASFARKFESLSRDVLGVDQTLEEWVEGDFSGTEGFEMKLLLMGKPSTPQDYLERARMRYDFERSGAGNFFGNLMMDGLEALGAHSNSALLLKHTAEVEAMFDENGKLTDPDKFEELKEICDWQEQDAKNYREVRDTATDAIVNAIQVVASIVLMIIPGGQAAAVGILMRLIQMAIAAAKQLAVMMVTMTVKAGLKGGGYGWEEMLMDLGEGAIDAASAGLGDFLKTGKMAAQAAKAGKGIIKEGAKTGFKAFMKEAASEMASGAAESMAKAVLHSEQALEGGNFFEHIAKQTAMGAVKSGAKFVVGKGIGKLTGGKLEAVEGNIEKGKGKIIEHFDDAGKLVKIDKIGFMQHYGLKLLDSVSGGIVDNALDMDKWEAWAKGEGFDFSLLKSVLLDPLWQDLAKTGISRSKTVAAMKAKRRKKDAQLELDYATKKLQSGDSDLSPDQLRHIISEANGKIAEENQVIADVLQGAADERATEAARRQGDADRLIQQADASDASESGDDSPTGAEARRRVRDAAEEVREVARDTPTRRIDGEDVANLDADGGDSSTRRARREDDTAVDTSDTPEQRRARRAETDAKVAQEADFSGDDTRKARKTIDAPQELEDGAQRFKVFANYDDIAAEKGNIIGAKVLGDDGVFSPEAKAKLEKLGYVVRENNVIARSDTGTQVPLHIEGGKIVPGLKVSGKTKTPTHLANELLPGGSRGEIWNNAKTFKGQEITLDDGRTVRVTKVVPTAMKTGVDSEGQAFAGRRIALVTDTGETIYRPVADFYQAHDPTRVVSTKERKDDLSKSVAKALAKGEPADITGGDPAAATQVFASAAVRKAVNKHFEEAPDAPAERRKQVKNLLDSFGGDFSAAHNSFDTAESRAVKKALNQHRGKLVGSLMAEVQEQFPGMKVTAKRLDPNSPKLTFEFEGAETPRARAFLEQASQQLFGGSLSKTLGVEISDGPVRVRPETDPADPTSGTRRVQGQMNDPLTYEDESGTTRHIDDGAGGKWGYQTKFGFDGEVADDGSYVIRQKVVLVVQDKDDPAMQRTKSDVEQANSAYFNDPKHRIVVDGVERTLRQEIEVEVVTQAELDASNAARQRARDDAQARGEDHDDGPDPVVMNVHKGHGDADSANLYSEGPQAPSDDKYRQMVIAHEMAHAVWGLADRYADHGFEIDNPDYDPSNPASQPKVKVTSSTRGDKDAQHVSREQGLMEDFNVAYTEAKKPMGSAKRWEDLAAEHEAGIVALYERSNKELPKKSDGSYDLALALKKLNPQLADEGGSFPRSLTAGQEVVLPALTAPEGWGASTGNLKQLEWTINKARHGAVKFDLGDGDMPDKIVEAEKRGDYRSEKARFSKKLVEQAGKHGYDTSKISPTDIATTKRLSTGPSALDADDVKPKQICANPKGIDKATGAKEGVKPRAAKPKAGKGDKTEVPPSKVVGGKEQVDLAKSTKRQLADMGLDDDEISVVRSHVKGAKGFDIEAFVKANPKLNPGSLGKIAKLTGSEDAVVAMTRKRGESPAETAHRLGLDSAKYGRQVVVSGVAELHNHFKGVLDAEDFPRILFPEEHDRDPKVAAKLTLDKLREFYDDGPDGGKNSNFDGVLTNRDGSPKVSAKLIKDILNQPGTDADPMGTLKRVLSASAEMPFDYTYDPRGAMLKYLESPDEGITDRRSVKAFVEATVERLAGQGIKYVELQGKLTTPGMSAEEFQAICKDKGIMVRMLPHLLTAQMAVDDEGKLTGTPITEEQVYKMLGKSKDSDEPVSELVAGLDICGPEAGRWSKDSIGQVDIALKALALEAEKADRPLVLRPHVGEGYSEDPEIRRHGGGPDSEVAKTARNNLTVLLNALEKNPDYEPPPKGKVIVRLGHVTHATDEHIAQMKRLGVIAEVNVGSNLATGALPADSTGKGRLDEHPLIKLMLAGVKTTLSTDAQGVMSTNMGREYGFAADMLDDFRRGRTSIMLDGKQTHWKDLTPDQQQTLGLGTLHTEAVNQAWYGYDNFSRIREQEQGGSGLVGSKIIDDDGQITAKGREKLDEHGYVWQKNGVIRRKDTLRQAPLHIEGDGTVTLGHKDQERTARIKTKLPKAKTEVDGPSTTKAPSPKAPGEAKKTTDPDEIKAGPKSRHKPPRAPDDAEAKEVDAHFDKFLDGKGAKLSPEVQELIKQEMACNATIKPKKVEDIPKDEGSYSYMKDDLDQYSRKTQKAILDGMDEGSVLMMRDRPPGAEEFNGLYPMKAGWVKDTQVVYKYPDGRRIVWDDKKKHLVTMLSDLDVADYTVGGKWASNDNFENGGTVGNRINSTLNREAGDTPEAVDGVQHGMLSRGLTDPEIRDMVLTKLGKPDEHGVYTDVKRITDMFEAEVFIFAKTEDKRGFQAKMTLIDALRDHNREAYDTLARELPRQIADALGLPKPAKAPEAPKAPAPAAPKAPTAKRRAPEVEEDDGEDFDHFFSPSEPRRTQRMPAAGPIDEIAAGQTRRRTMKMPAVDPGLAKAATGQTKPAKTSKLPKRHHDDVPDTDTPTMVMKAFDPKEAAPARRQRAPARLADLLGERDRQALATGDANTALAVFADPAKRSAVARGIATSEGNTETRTRLVNDLLEGFGGDFRTAHATFAAGDTSDVTQALEQHRGRQLQAMMEDLQRAFPELKVTTHQLHPNDPTLRLNIEGGRADLAQAYLQGSAGLHHGDTITNALGIELNVATTGLMPNMMRSGPEDITLDIPEAAQPQRQVLETTGPMEVTAPLPETTVRPPERKVAEDVDKARDRSHGDPTPEQIEAFRRNNMNYDFHEEDVAQLLADRPELQRMVTEHGLTHEEVVAVYAYSRQDYADMNMALRGEAPEMMESYRAQIAITASALDKLPDVRGAVFRRVEGGAWTDAYQEGATITEDAFTSTSTEYDTQLGKSGQGKVEFVIKSRTGKNITDLSGKGELENEVLFDRNTSFAITQRIIDDDGTVVIYMDEVPAQRKAAPSPRAPSAPSPRAPSAPSPKAPSTEAESKTSARLSPSDELERLQKQKKQATEKLDSQISDDSWRSSVTKNTDQVRLIAGGELTRLLAHDRVLSRGAMSAMTDASKPVSKHGALTDYMKQMFSYGRKDGKIRLKPDEDGQLRVREGLQPMHSNNPMFPTSAIGPSTHAYTDQLLSGERFMVRFKPEVYERMAATRNSSIVESEYCIAHQYTLDDIDYIADVANNSYLYTREGGYSQEGEAHKARANQEVTDDERATYRAVGGVIDDIAKLDGTDPDAFQAGFDTLSARVDGLREFGVATEPMTSAIVSAPGGPASKAPPAPAPKAPRAPGGGDPPKKRGPVDLEAADQNDLVKAGFTKREARRILNHREINGGGFDFADYAAQNADYDIRLVAKAARLAGREEEAVTALRLPGESLAETAQRVGLNPEPFGRRVKVKDVAEVHNHLAGVLRAEDFPTLLFPDLVDDPQLAATKTVERLRELYDTDPWGTLDNAKNGPSTEKMREILSSPIAEQDPMAALRLMVSASNDVTYRMTYVPRAILVDQINKREGGGGGEAIARATLLRLKEEGVVYAELQGMLDKIDITPERFAEIANEPDIDIKVRLLPNLSTTSFSADGKDFDEDDVKRRLFGKDYDRKDHEHRDVAVPDLVAGIDICGQETTRWDAKGMERMDKLFDILETQAGISGRKLVLRPHVGEGHPHADFQRRIGVEGDSPQAELAHANLDTLLNHMLANKERYTNPDSGVEIRLGHVTQATDEQIAKMKELGIIAEVNIGSNLVTGVLRRHKGTGGARLDEHPLLQLLYHDVRTLLSTDAQGTMNTSVPKEYGFAADMLDKFRAGEIAITVPDPKDPTQKVRLRYDDLDPETKKRFHLEHLEKSAQDYAREATGKSTPKKPGQPPKPRQPAASGGGTGTAGPTTAPAGADHAATGKRSKPSARPKDEMVTLTGNVEVPLKHLNYEQVAHDVTYNYDPETGGLKEFGDRPAMNAAQTEEYLARMGYQMPTFHEDPESAFRMMGFMPTEGSDNVPLLSFRGTDSGKALRDDLNPSMVGAKQFHRNRAAIQHYLENMQKESGRKVDVTGHSLGGGLAERAATEFGGMIGGGATFQSAGVQKRHVDEHRRKHGGAADDDRQHDFTHYIAGGDVVDLAGLHLDGRVIQGDTTWVPELGHTHMLLDGHSPLKELDHHPSLDANSAYVQEVRELAGKMLENKEFYADGNPALEITQAAMTMGICGDPTLDMDGYLGSQGIEVWAEQSKEEVIDHGTDVELRESARDAVDSHDAGTVLDSTKDGTTGIELDHGLERRAVDADLRRTAAAAVDPNELGTAEDGRVIPESSIDAAINSRDRKRWRSGYSPRTAKVLKWLKDW